MNNFKEKAMKIVFLLTASFSILAVALICVFLFANGIPAIKEIGLPDFLLGTKWKPGNNLYGIFPMILGSIYVTAGAIVVGVPIGILMAIFMARFCPKKLHSFLKPMVDLLAGIPSIVYGFFGLVVIGSRLEFALVLLLCIAVGLVLLSVMLPLLGVLTAIG